MGTRTIVFGGGSLVIRTEGSAGPRDSVLCDGGLTLSSQSRASVKMPGQPTIFIYTYSNQSTLLNMSRRASKGAQSSALSPVASAASLLSLSWMSALHLLCLWCSRDSA